MFTLFIDMENCCLERGEEMKNNRTWIDKNEEFKKAMLKADESFKLSVDEHIKAIDELTVIWADKIATQKEIAIIEKMYNKGKK
jgi:hypothetical protein